MIADTNKETSKALILSGGGITGTAWELGVLFGLEECGVDVTDVELIVGTSAGSSVGAQITSGLSLEELYNLQLKPIHETLERPVDFNGHKFRQMMAAAIMSSPDSQTARARIGEAALAIVLADALLEKFGGDHISEALRNYKGYLDSIGPEAG